MLPKQISLPANKKFSPARCMIKAVREVPAGTTLTDKELLSMDWFVKGVDGKIQN